MFDLQILSKGKTISTDALRKFTARRKWQVRDTLFAAPVHTTPCAGREKGRKL